MNHNVDAINASVDTELGKLVTQAQMYKTVLENPESNEHMKKVKRQAVMSLIGSYGLAIEYRRDWRLPKKSIDLSEIIPTDTLGELVMLLTSLPQNIIIVQDDYETITSRSLLDKVLMIATLVNDNFEGFVRHFEEKLERNGYQISTPPSEDDVANYLTVSAADVAANDLDTSITSAYGFRNTIIKYIMARFVQPEVI